MTKRKKLRLLISLGVAIVVTTFLAAGLSELELLPGRSQSLLSILEALGGDREPFPAIQLPFDWLRLLLACVWILLFISIILFIFSPQLWKETLKRIITYLVWFLLIYVMIFFLQPFLRFAGEETQDGSDSLLGTPVPLEPIPAPPAFIANPPQWFVIMVSILIIALPLALIWFVWYRLARPKRESPLEQLAREAQHALENLQAGSDLKDTVKRCYLEMNQTLRNQRGLHRQQAMTPREFERYLAESGLRNEHIQRLTRLFESVRYGFKPPGQRAEREAMDCLRAIVRAYGKSS